MKSASTQYLLRFDDLCPTMTHAAWLRYERLLSEFKVQPILAVIPDNRDPELMVDAADPQFWNRMRTLQKRGATIALHGLTHLCNARGKGLLPLHGQTEFAGADAHLQRQWIEEGLAILRAHRLQPRLFVAPRHGFDVSTLRALHASGIEYLSDGLAHAPFRRGGIVWIPQQLWKPVAQGPGLWTICLHTNTATEQDFIALRHFLAAHAAQFTSFERVCAEYQPREAPWQEAARASLALLRMRMRAAAKSARTSGRTPDEPPN